MPRMIFVNLPVKDLARSIEFFRGLGFNFNEQFTNEQAGYMVVNDQAAVMLVTEPFFRTFSDKAIADTSAQIEVSNAVSADSREAVDELVEKALASGGHPSKAAPTKGSCTRGVSRIRTGICGTSSGWTRARSSDRPRGR